jgi:hypothetical protein
MLAGTAPNHLHASVLMRAVNQHRDWSTQIWCLPASNVMRISCWWVAAPDCQQVWLMTAGFQSSSFLLSTRRCSHHLLLCLCLFHPLQLHVDVGPQANTPAGITTTSPTCQLPASASALANHVALPGVAEQMGVGGPGERLKQQQQQQSDEEGASSDDEDGSCWSDSVSDSVSDSDSGEEEQVEDELMTSESHEERQHQHEVKCRTKGRAQATAAAAAAAQGKHQRFAALAVAKAVSGGSRHLVGLGCAAGWLRTHHWWFEHGPFLWLRLLLKHV